MFEGATRKLVLSFLLIHFSFGQNLSFRKQPIEFIEKHFKQILPRLDSCGLIFISEHINVNDTSNFYINQGMMG